MPKVFVSTVPAEMILLAGEPTYKPVAGHAPALGQQHRERRVPGRARRAPSTTSWPDAGSRSPGFEGPWTFATPSLPADFQKITLEHPRSRVLASVPGTQQAAEAVLLAQVPQTARVNKKELKAPEVVYEGEPKFEPIEKTKVEHAVNTDKASSRSATCTTCASRACGSWEEPERPLDGRDQGAGGDLRDPDQLARPQRHLRDRVEDDDDDDG